MYNINQFYIHHDRFIYLSLYYLLMNHEEEDWKRQIEKFKVVQKCPKCNEITLKFIEGKIKCSNCGFEQNVGEIK